MEETHPWSHTHTQTQTHTHTRTYTHTHTHTIPTINPLLLSLSVNQTPLSGSSDAFLIYCLCAFCMLKVSLEIASSLCYLFSFLSLSSSVSPSLPLSLCLSLSLPLSLPLFLSV